MNNQDKNNLQTELHEVIQEFKSRLDNVERQAQNWNADDIQRLMDSLNRNMSLLSRGVSLVSQSTR